MASVPGGEAGGHLPAEIEAVLAGLDGCRRRRSGRRTGWYVSGLLVARPDTPGTMLIRITRAEREPLVTAQPETFGVPPRWEAHDKVQAQLDGDRASIDAAIRMAWDRQRRA